MYPEQETPLGAGWAIQADDAGVRIVRVGTDEMAWQMEWHQVESIVVWKDDLFTYDIVCMGFAWAGSDVLKILDEEMAGWDDLHRIIERKFGVSLHQWWLDVAVPAFSENRRAIWKRQAF